MQMPDRIASIQNDSAGNSAWIARLLFAAITISLSSCTVGPDYKEPRVNVPAAWRSDAATSQPATAATAPHHAAEPTENLANWWTVLGDQTLNALLTRVVAQNNDLKQAAERISQARAMRGMARSENLPTVNAVGSYQRSRLSPNTPLGGFFDGKSGDDWQGGFDASWEIDFFGRIRRSIEAADAGLEAAHEAQRDIRVRLLAETARDYVALRASQRRLAIANDTLRAQRDTLELVKARRNAGALSDLDVSRAQADVRMTEATLPVLQGDIDEVIFAIGALLGVAPNELYETLAVAQPVPVPVRSVPLGLPSELLTRRPDIRLAQRRAAAATARIGVAMADLYPRLSLTGSFVMDASRFSRVGNWDSRQFGIGPTVTWNIFDAGRIRNNVNMAESQQREAILQYQQVVVDSLKEVETAISRYKKEFARRTSLEEAVKNNEQSVFLAKEQYKAGAIDLLQVLDTQRNLFSSQDQLARSDQALATNLISLYKSLGGGWDESDQKPRQVSNTE